MPSPSSSPAGVPPANSAEDDTNVARPAESTFVRGDDDNEAATSDGSDEDVPLLLGSSRVPDADAERKHRRAASIRRERRIAPSSFERRKRRQFMRPRVSTSSSSSPLPPRSLRGTNRSFPGMCAPPRSMLLSLSLSLVLCSFWVLDSLKDPIFAALVEGDLRTHQPRAKLVSVAGQVGLVWILETVLRERKKRRRRHCNKDGRSGHDKDIRVMDDAEVTDGGGKWTKMTIDVGRGVDRWESLSASASDERIPVSVFWSIGMPYSIAFALGAWMLRRHSSFTAPIAAAAHTEMDGTNVAAAAAAATKWPDLVEGECYAWRALGYVLYLAIESYGSLSVAALWSFANSTLSLRAAEEWYGTIVACAQLGAIGGSTLAAKMAHGRGGPEGGSVGGELSGVPGLFLLAIGGVALQMAVMAIYGRLFPLPMFEEESEEETHQGVVDVDVSEMRKRVSFHRTLTPRLSNSSRVGGPRPSSVLHLILRHNYLLLILGVSCLYEISLTCLDYQLKLIGLERFGEDGRFGNDGNSALGGAVVVGGGMAPTGAAWALAATFSQFMGRFGQLTNALSLVLSYFAFPYLMRHYGLNRTIMLFPTLLIAVTLVNFLALPLNLPTLFVSMSALKAMTYSVNDPAKEILYIPTSDDVKFRCKFWIDVVGARVAKGVGSSLNTYAGSAERVVRYGTVPSVATAVGLWAVCRAAGREFDRLLTTGEVVGEDGTGGGRRRNEQEEEDVEVDLTEDGSSPVHFELVGEECGAGAGTDDKKGADTDII